MVQPQQNPNYKPNGQPQPISEDKKARIVVIKPGISSEKAIKKILPENMYNATVDEIIKYVLNDGDMKRSEERIAERVKNEMKGTYGVTANEQKVQGNDKIADLFKDETTPGGMEYKEIEFVVAEDQDGGLEYKIR